MPKASWQHLTKLTDDFSIWQHTDGAEIDRRHGYALDDSARALLLAAQAGEDDLADIYLHFLEQACQPPTIVNFFDAERRPRPLPWSEDAVGEAIWALAVASLKPRFRKPAVAVLQQLLPVSRRFQSARGRAYAILGAVHVAPKLALKFAQQLTLQYDQKAQPDWPWLEPKLTYANAIIPLALLTAAEARLGSRFQTTGLTMLHFLNEQCSHHSLPIAIGNNGWQQPGSPPVLFGQQPIDPSYQVLANVLAYRLTNSPVFLREAKRFFAWFHGYNLLGLPIYDQATGRCHDGLEADGVSANCGAESIICYLLAKQALAPYSAPPTVYQPEVLHVQTFAR